MRPLISLIWMTILKPRQELTIAATSPDGSKKQFNVIARVDTPVEVDYLRNGGILQTVLRKLAKDLSHAHFTDQ